MGRVSSRSSRNELDAFLATLDAEGHALEFEAAQAFADAGFDVSQNVGYVDPQSAIGRETDVAAYLRKPSGEGSVSVLLAVECKKLHKGIIGVFVAREHAHEPVAPTFRIGKYLEGNLRDGPVLLDFPVDVHAFKAVLKFKDDRKHNRDSLWEAIQQGLSARNGLVARRRESEAVTCAMILVVDAELVAVENSASGLTAQPIGSAAVRVAGALGRAQDTFIVVERTQLSEFALRMASKTNEYLDALAPKLELELSARSPVPIEGRSSSSKSDEADTEPKDPDSTA